MKKLLFLIAIFCALETNAQVYLISFAGTGASSTVGSVKVENLTAGTSLTLSGSSVLRLSILTGIEPVRNKQSSELKIYPNPATGNSVLQIYPPTKGNADIRVFDMTGREVAQMQSYLENSLQEFRISGLPGGFYMISVTGNSYSLSGKLISNGNASGQVSIRKLSSNLAAEEKASENKGNKGVMDYIDMPYSVGDRIKFTGTSGDYSTVKTDIPTGDKTITFNFIFCTDGDLNNYPVVEIGEQVWMAMNLKSLRYSNSDFIGTTKPLEEYIHNEVASKYQWAYNKSESNVAAYGRLYTWYAVMDERNVCPAGWHVPTIAEWNTLFEYMGGNDIAGGKLKEPGTTHWISPSRGTDDAGFSLLPGGSRYVDGSYYNLRQNGLYWSATQSDFDSTMGSCPVIIYDSPIAYISGQWKHYGLSVRCLKN